MTTGRLGRLLASVMVAGVVGVSLWVAFRYLSRWSARRRAKREAYEERHDEDGQLLPPVARGICQQCQRVSDMVYHLPSGRRLCENCYEPEGPDALAEPGS
ncbi:MAG: hypothetical protein ACYS8X_12505 [Planctomycetota bacterium]